jgi:hypothetical protein
MLKLLDEQTLPNDHRDYGIARLIVYASGFSKSAQY